ncbi:hypothetical protein EJ02DRAFT_491909 [Clathrospora elynae]|uniref:Uncharacterized protein n=1 Tax=Clathrospora elynae TaxID=706981 RepID=A0A6A5TD79_9PLEO|nr:hypothetical protein EJ02DRAFT_491909 [Clathrospora elynae]
MAGPQKVRAWRPGYYVASSRASSDAGSDGQITLVGLETSQPPKTYTTPTPPVGPSLELQRTENQPQSKIAIARMTYHLKHLPELNHALKELLARHKFDTIRDIIAVNTKASRYIEHIIIPIHDQSDHGNSIKELVKPGTESLTKTTKPINIGERLVNQVMRCQIMEGRTYSDDCLSHLYWKSLIVLIRKRAMGGDCTSKYGIDHEFTQPFPNTTNMTEIDASIEKAINGRALDHMSTIEKIVRGISVRCAFVAPDKDAMRKGTKGETFLNRHELAQERVRRSQVTAIKMPNEVPEFTVDGQKGSYSVQAYFNNILKDGKTLEKQDGSQDQLQLLSDGKGHWVPMDMVSIDDPSISSRFDYLHPWIKSKINTLYKQKTAEERIQTVDQAFFEKVAKKSTEVSERCQPRYSIAFWVFYARGMFATCGMFAASGVFTASGVCT